MSPQEFQFQRAMPVLPIIEMERSLAFYRALGFEAATWGEPPTFAIVQRGLVTLALGVRPQEEIRRSGLWSSYIYVRDADAVHAELSRHGIAAEPPETRAYNCRDFTVDDPDGNLIGIGHVLSADALAPGLSAHTGRDGEGRP